MGDALKNKGRKTVEVPAGEANPRESARARAVKLAMQNCTPWHAQENGPPRGFASYEKDGHTEHVELRSTAGRLWLGGMVWRATGEALSRQDIDGALDNLEAAAVHDGPRIPVHVRVADLGEEVFIDLADPEWNAVHVTRRGWEVVPQGDLPVRFRRPNGTESLPMPVHGGKLEDLGRFVNTDPHGLVLFAAWLVGALTDRGPAPVLSLAGGQGSAKSTATRICHRLVDPRGGALRAAPQKLEDLAVAAHNAWVVSLDNVSHMSLELSDGAARLSTGASFTTRTLYTNGDESIFAARRPLIINSIVDVVSRPDLMERTITVHLQRIDDERRMEESEFWAGFEAERPRLFGAVLDALATALGRWKGVQLDRRPRMADWYRTAMAIGDLLPGGVETFEAAWAGMQEEATSSAIESCPFGNVLLKLLEARGKWRAPASELLRELNAARPIGKDADSWPHTPQGLVSSLKRLSPALRTAGWHTVFGVRDTRTYANHRNVVIVPLESLQERASILEVDAGMSRAMAEQRAALEVAS